jgi:cytoskeletal protein RodZ
MRRTNQGGSVASFIIVGIILVVVVSGVAYFVSQRGKQARIDQATTIAREQSKATTTEKQPAPAATADTNTDASSQASQSDTSASNLPETGPELNIIGFIGLALLTMTVMSFLTSRRQLAATL